MSIESHIEFLSITGHRQLTTILDDDPSPTHLLSEVVYGNRSHISQVEEEEEEEMKEPGTL